MSKVAERPQRKTASGRGMRLEPEAVVPVVEEVLVPSCAHHWVIASPDGEMSLGKCKRCGVEREFPNSAEDYLWERSVPQSRWTGRTELNTPQGY